MVQQLSNENNVGLLYEVIRSAVFVLARKVLISCQVLNLWELVDCVLLRALPLMVISVASLDLETQSM